MDTMTATKIRLCLKGIAHAKSVARRTYWETTLTFWDERARALGYASAAEWLQKEGR